jgi:hypothetical protein
MVSRPICYSWKKINAEKKQLSYMLNRDCNGWKIGNVFFQRFDYDTIFDLKKMHKTCLNKYETKKI